MKFNQGKTTIFTYSMRKIMIKHFKIKNKNKYLTKNTDRIIFRNNSFHLVIKSKSLLTLSIHSVDPQRTRNLLQALIQRK